MIFEQIHGDLERLHMKLATLRGIGVMPEYEIRVGFEEHGALTQLFRPYQIFERIADGVENRLDIPPNEFSPWVN